VKVYEARDGFLYPKSGEPTVKLDRDSNNWVKLEDANAAIQLARDERADSYGNGYANGMVVGLAKAQNKALSATLTGIPLADQSSATRTNQLLNELYHDRARLERVVKDAVALAKSSATALQWLNKEPEHVGFLRQFVDTHESD
jgi:hypothetical protein